MRSLPFSPLVMVALLPLLVGCGQPPVPAGPVQITFNAAGPDSTFIQEATWHPTGSHLLVSRLHIDRQYESTLAQVGADGTGFEALTSGPRDMWADWSPDGEVFVFSSSRDGNRDLFLRERETETRITDDPGEDTHPAFAPDGSRIAFVSNRTGVAQIFTMSPGQDPVQLTDGPGEKWNPRWSPDGGRIAYYANTGADSIHVVAADGSRTANLGPGIWPDFTPAGTLVFTHEDGIHRMQPDGTNRELLVDDAVIARVSPEGARLALVRITWRSDSGWPNISNLFVVPIPPES